MSIARTLPLLLLLVCSACSSRVLVASPGPGKPAPAVKGPVATLGIPPGHYPRPGQCRIWMPGVPPGRQAAPVPCTAIGGEIPLGAWVLYRPSKEKKVLKVTAYDKHSPSIVVSVNWYDAASGRLLRERSETAPARSAPGKGQGKGKSRS